VTFQPFEALTDAARASPDGIFYSDSEQTLTRDEARDMATQFAGQLRLLGVKAGDTVAVDLPTGMQVLFALAAFHVAAVSATVAAETAPHDIEWDWWVTSPDRSPGRTRNVVIVDNEFLIRAAGLATRVAPTLYETPDSMCRFALTSGTTGQPKAVGLSVAMVEHRAHETVKLFDPHGAFMCTLGLATTSGFHTLVASILKRTPYLAPGNGATNRDAILRHGVTAIKASPQQISDIVRASDGRTLDSLRRVYSAGGRISQTLIDSVATVSDATVVNLYGSSEAGRAAEAEFGAILDSAFAGYVVEQTDLEVVDGEGNPLPHGESGSIRYRAPHMATGYVNNAAASSDAFRDGWFYPGDRGRLVDDGSLFLDGRSSDILNAGGVKIDPKELEEFACTLSGIDEAIGFVHENEFGVPQFILAVAGNGIDIVTVSRELDDRFGRLRPAGIFSVPAIPRTETGKLSRRLAAQLYADTIERAKS
jgi:acyl-coenzyme A synthetase/AMP-(fatty) acid ligase